jgi:peptide/nickel transport system permease protein
MRLRRIKIDLVLGATILLAVAVAAIFYQEISGHDPFSQDLMKRMLPPFWLDGHNPDHILGTDQLGRDYLARLLYGARIVLLIGVGATIFAGIIGITLGILGGYFGGAVDNIVLFLITVRLSLPTVLVALAVVGMVGSSLTIVVTILALLLWDRFAVVARTTTMQIRHLDYIKSARVSGCSTSWILWREVLPNISEQLIVVATLEVTLAVLVEASLSFLGLGVPPPLPSWGLMISEGKDQMFFNAWIVTLPGVALMLVVIAINLVGEGVAKLSDGNGNGSTH